MRRHWPPSVARSCGLQDRSDPQYTTGTSAAALDAIALPETAPAIAPDRSASSRPPPSHVIRQPTLTHENQRKFQRSEEHTSELQSLMRISYAVLCLKKNTIKKKQRNYKNTTTQK